MAEKILCIHIMVFISELLCPLVQNKHRLEMETCFHRVIRAAISIYNEISIILYKISDHIAAGVAKEEKGKRKPLGRAEGLKKYMNMPEMKLEKRFLSHPRPPHTSFAEMNLPPPPAPGPKPEWPAPERLFRP